MATAGRSTAAKKVRRKEKKNVVAGHAHIKSTFNNTVISITDPNGQRHCMGFSRNRRIQRIPQVHPVRRADGRRGRRSPSDGAWHEAGRCVRQGSRALVARLLSARSGPIGLEVGAISDVTPVPHNGCRPPKRRRV